MTITLAEIKAEHSKVAEMIAKFETQSKAYFEHQGKRIPLAAGERYLATVVSADQTRNHHIILLPGESTAKPWKEQLAWAASIGGELPDRVEGALLFALMQDEFKREAYWTREQHAADSDYAWFQNFVNGVQYYIDTDDELRARAIRRSSID